MGEEEEGEKQASFSSGKQPKHLFRDAENRIIGGVGAGLGAYFNTDPLWFNLFSMALG